MDDFFKFWPTITWILLTAFYTGIVWYKVESARGAIKLLFEKVGQLEKHTAKHCAEIENCEASILKVEKESMEHRQEATNRYAALVIRVDQIFSLLTEIQRGMK